ncbi:MAG: twin-arginine translocase TatA/TatE family subunit [Halobacteriovoraceae bacterium]|jgi:sec-independent protein translocase protein TatA|nr:twin-arginine translocase TatA/TatE family subunit [Halobacteriovoraceae bacterium]|tara:strand:- start:1780 stop:1977 length:198 start_codon:yes stop_codon:yes gene_type:complete
MFGLGMGEALILLAVVVLLFGGKKLPELGSSMGKALTNFKKGMKEDDSDAVAKKSVEDQNDKGNA